jgi:hypothetical protein
VEVKGLSLTLHVRMLGDHLCRSPCMIKRAELERKVMNKVLKSLTRSHNSLKNPKERERSWCGF